MKTLTLDDLLVKKERKPARIPASEIAPGSVVYCAMLTADERDLCEIQWSNYCSAFNIESNVGLRKFILAYCLCDEQNNRLLDPGPEENRVRPEFIEAMNQLGESVPANVVSRFFDVASKKMGLTKTDVEELEKNSATPTSEDGSGSKPKQSAKAAKRGSRRSKTPKS